MGQQVKVTGMVLSATNVSDYDKRIVILTKERGKMVAFARGARKMNSPLLAACQPFVYGIFTVFEGKHCNINSVDVEDYFEELRGDLQNLYRGFYFCEMADYFTVERNDDLQIMQLLYVSLCALRKDKIEKELIQVIYELKIIAYFGLMMETSQCAGCAKLLTKEHLEQETLHLPKGYITHFSSDKGGILCHECAKKYAHCVSLQESTLYALQYILSQPVTKLYTFRVTDVILKQLQQISKDYQKVHINHTFRSLEFLTLANSQMPERKPR